MTATDARTQDRNAGVADDARANLAAFARDAADFRELGLMLGLFEVDPNGSVVAANPLNAESRLSRTALTSGVNRC